MILWFVLITNLSPSSLLRNDNPFGTLCFNQYMLLLPYGIILSCLQQSKPVSNIWDTWIECIYYKIPSQVYLCWYYPLQLSRHFVKKIQGMKLHQTLRKNNEALNDIGISREERKKRKSRGGWGEPTNFNCYASAAYIFSFFIC